MLPEIKYLPVNWVDGMKISKQHFVHQENAMYEQVRDAISANLTDYNYGVLPASPNDKQSLDIRVQLEQNDLLRVKVLACRAITRGGVRIELTGNRFSGEQALNQSLEATYKIDNPDKLLLDVIVTANPFSRVQVGQPEPEETPLRYPYTMPEYRLEIVPSDQTNITDIGAYHLTIGQVRVISNEAKLTEQYFPAATTVQSYPPLMNVYYEFGNALGQLGADTISIIKKIKIKNERGQLAENVHYLADKMADFLSNNMDHYRLAIPQQSPIFMVEFFARFARVVKTAVACVSDTGKEEMLKYFMEWSDLRPGMFENTTDTLLEQEYNHTDISRSIKSSDKFLNMMGALFRKLSQLDYIGKGKETPKAPEPKPSIFINEEEETRKKKGLWNF